MPGHSGRRCRLFWLLASCLSAAFLCLRSELATQPEEEPSPLPVLQLSLAFLLCYSLIKSWCPVCPHQPCPVLAPSASLARKAALESYYEQRLKVSPHVLGHSRAHVSQIVGELLRVGRAEQDGGTLAFRGDFLQIGSTWEQHQTNSPDCFDLLVPIKVPQVLQLDASFQPGAQSVPLSLGGTAICRVKPCSKPEGARCRREFLESFCVRFEKQRALSSAQVLSWFHAKVLRCLRVIRFQWEQRCSISLVPHRDQLILKLLPRADYLCCHISLSVRLIPALHVGDSVFLVAESYRGKDLLLPALTPGTLWAVYLSKHEHKFLNWLRAQTPSNSCHLKCLQLMKVLRDLGCREFDQRFSVQWNTILCTYNMKTALFHLLLKGPLDAWDERFLMERLQDLVLFWRERLQKQELMHFFLGNKNVPDFLTVPRKIKEVLPVNLLAGFDAALLDLVSFQLLKTWNCAHLIMKLHNHKHSPRNY
ncbi:inositol 1,4,5-trisphosphate receptor-interacting protein-like 2 [Chiloscyllium plagiosum]|uniref:inositol 1,4,5-trisphosphate receptor-interacting protein-like 2 n=1 Tax=Chiloscyllium plagiosum TaxID=36176 RepID=UPI001CB82794|nr:inositol 1,4,5-trisphosphate receptor-interacting protein-like 2 [Chiloscyllium plagiosum]